MSSYSSDQLRLYFQRIRYPPSEHPSDRLAFLTDLLKYQLVYVPFETLSLHYSVNRQISLDRQDLFDKIVGRCRGGYCLENNTFFGAVLESLDFRVMGVFCRITYATRGIYDGSWRAMSHMANVVTVGSSRYLVDVGYGADGPCYPLPLQPGEICAGLPGQQLKLEKKKLSQHTDPDQTVWVYSQRREPGNWQEVYHFPDVEMFPEDFEVLNHYAVTKSLWSQVVVAQRFVLGEADDPVSTKPSGTLLLIRNQLKSRIGQQEELVRTVETEEERILTLEKDFGISLTGEECRAIKGFASELK
ncbi:cysteine proteinase [Cadophora sp. DSE1049]|nr:cysteine proteinase [Cadophora sp. DSE1049]